MVDPTNKEGMREPVPFRFASQTDAAAFEAALCHAVEGEVRFDAGSKAVYSADASNYRQVPIAVVVPRDAMDVVRAVDICARFDVPVLPRGGGTSQCGQGVNVAVVLDMSKYMNRVLDIDPVSRVGTVEPGTVCDALRDAAEAHGLTFGPDPATHSRCTLGGMIGNNSCGAHSVMAGKTVENIEALEVLTYDGARFWTGPTSEHELEQIIRAGGRRAEIYASLRALRDKYADAIRAEFPRINRRVSGYKIMIEFGADTADAAKAKAQALIDSYRGDPHAPSHWLVEDKTWASRIWTIRETGASATSLQSRKGEPDPAVGWEDAAVDPARLGDYLREFQRLIDRYGYKTSLFGHFGDGCIHARITFDLRNAEGIAVWRSFLREAAELVVKYGGSLSGEHGDGQAKAEFLPVMYSPTLMQALREFKAIWDPRNRMNPHKLIDPYRVDQHLRLGPEYRPIEFKTEFRFPKDGTGRFDHFSRAVERCVGMGKCRSQEGGTMCPSYRATGEERHSTRGRARLFFEMLRGEVVTDGWQSEEVKEALDLCLACKGCKSDCPTHVDMATYKAEFLSHYYRHKPRPVQAYAMGMIAQWVPVAALVPGVVNYFTQTRPLKNIVQRLTGMAVQRSIPRLARRTFRASFAPAREHGTRVLLWPDTFSNHFHPEAAHAAVRVLEDAGCTVTLPQRRLCCGRPLYDFGMLDRARAQLLDILNVLKPEIESGTPVIMLEPSCHAVFKDELLNLLPDDPLAVALSSQTFTLPEYLVTLGYKPGHLGTSALMHGHCHQKAVQGVSAELAMLEAAGISCRTPESGCCGMAGSFGFDRERYAVSMKIGERHLIPAVRAEAPDTLVIANGFSCREQITQATGRKVMHIAEVLDSARTGRSDVPDTPERRAGTSMTDATVPDQHGQHGQHGQHDLHGACSQHQTTT